VLERAPDLLGLDELDRVVLGKDLDVVCDIRQWRTELAGELGGAGHAQVERLQDPPPKGMRERLDETEVRFLPTFALALPSRLGHRLVRAYSGVR
jgi:hypothetical protein